MKFTLLVTNDLLQSFQKHKLRYWFSRTPSHCCFLESCKNQSNEAAMMGNEYIDTITVNCNYQIITLNNSYNQLTSWLSITITFPFQLITFRITNTPTLITMWCAQFPRRGARGVARAGPRGDGDSDVVFPSQGGIPPREAKVTTCPSRHKARRQNAINFHSWT